MPKSNQSCEVCNTAFGDRWEGGVQVICDGPCGKSFHTLCTGLNMTHLNAWTAKVGLQWFCSTCRLDFDSGVRHRESVLQTSIRKMFGEVQRTIRDLELRVDSMDKYMKQHKQVDSVGDDKPPQEVNMPGAQQIVPSVEKSTKSYEELAGGECIISEPERKMHLAQKELIISSTYDSPATCTDRDDLATVSIMEESAPQVSSKNWAQIFQYLNFINLCQVRLVCREWKKIVDADQSTMGKFRLAFPRNTIIDRYFEGVVMLPTSTITFKECSIFAVGPWWTPKITENLVQLELTKCRISLNNLLQMLRYTANLNSLSLSCGSTLTCNSTVDKFSDLRLEKMETLEVDCVEQDEVLNVLGKIFPRLKNFILLSGYDGNCRRGIKDMMELIKSVEGVFLPFSVNVLSDLAAGLEHRLKRASVEVPVSDDLNRQLIHFSQKQPSLEYFDFNVRSVIKTYKNKEHALNNKTLSEIFQNLPKLKRLSMRFSFHRSEYSQDKSAEINLLPLNSLTQLEYLSFIGKDTAGYQEILFHGARNPKLMELHLGRVTPPSSSPSVRIALQEYISNAPNLRVISLDQCYLDSWSTVFASTQLVERLKLTNVHAESECNLVEYFDFLRYLELTDCPMSEDFLSTLFCLSPRVEELTLSKMVHAVDAVVLMLSQKMKQLRKLTLDQCPITDAAIGHIIEYAESLEQLTIKSCSALSPEAKSQLKDAKILKLTFE